MKKILLTVILSSLLPALAVAEDKKMQNTQPQTQPNQSDINMKEKKHMSMGDSPFTSQSDINMKEKKHMSMGDNPFSSHDKKVQKVQKVQKKANKGYTVIKYEK
ncbi:MAG: hypothetical protein KAH20_05715 [Methylococcales bacterium]|nr:hypothetical protein [Methylococcales bacterium]